LFCGATQLKNSSEQAASADEARTSGDLFAQRRGCCVPESKVAAGTQAGAAAF